MVEPADATDLLTPGSWPQTRLRTRGEGVGELTVSAELTNAAGMLFGGWQLGLVAQVAGDLTGRRLRDLSLSFLRPVRTEEVLAVRAGLLTPAGSLAHVRAEGWVAGAEVFAASVVTGPPAVAPVGRPAPAVPPPDACPARRYGTGPGTGGSVLVEVRVAGEQLVDGPGSRSLLWTRVSCPVTDDVRLAAVCDHVPYLLRRSMGRLAGAATVAATLRSTGGPVGEWVLLDVRLLATDERLAIGRVDMWSEGRFAGTSEQTVRLFTSG